MRYAILSDIHSNLEALTAVLDRLSGDRIDRYCCLGDLIGYGADPEACLARLRSLETISVCGNHEWACLGKLDPEWFSDSAKAAVLWTRDRLTFTDLDELRRLPLTLSDGPVTLVHGTLNHPDRFEYLMDLAHAIDTARTCRTQFCLVGHTHVPLLFEYDTDSRSARRVCAAPDELAAGVRLAEAGAPMRYVINPGSVGQPRDGDPRASCAVLDTDARMLSIRRVAYDIAAAQRKIRDAGLPAFLADRLAMGR